MRPWINLMCLLLVVSLACGTSAPVIVEPGSPSQTAAPETAPPIPPGAEGLFPTANATLNASIALDISGRYLMSFHACDMNDCQQGPMSHMVYLAQSDDGERWSLVPGWQPYRGSVPDVIRRGNMIYVFTPNQMVRYSLTTQTFEGPFQVVINGMAEGFVDPSLFMDEQGKLVLFFLYGRMGSDPAGCSPGIPTCVQRFGSATELEGSDGTQFTLDEGDRVSITVSEGSTLRSASDPDIFFDGAQYFIYISHGPSISVWTSAELRGSFVQITSLPDNLLSLGSGGVPAGYFDDLSGLYWTFAHAPRRDSATNIYRAVHSDFSRQIGNADWVVVVSGETLGLGNTINVESPGFAVNAP